MEQRARPRILVLLGAYWPGHDATGPNQSFRALAEALGRDFDFNLVARDRPFGASEPLIGSGAWTDAGFARIHYLTASKIGARGLVEVLRATPHQLLMLNGFFDSEFTIPALIARRRGLVPRPPAILSTRGEFAGGALSLKSGRKRAFLKIARGLGLHRDVWLHATVPEEADDIRRTYPHGRGVLVAPNVRTLGPLPRARDRSATTRMRLAFLGRITPVKNLHFALQVLAGVNAPVDYDIYGPVGDAAYWQHCSAIIDSLPSHVTVTLKGSIPNSDVPERLAAADMLFLPTLGENFGHAILDALAAGTPVLISDRTPFRNLHQQSAGWDLPLDDPAPFARVIDTYAAAGPEERQRTRAAARALAERRVEASDAVRLNREMLKRVLAPARPDEA